MSTSKNGPSSAVVFGCAGATLGREERRLFADVQPLGFILFKRNCENPDQLRTLIDDLRASVGRADAPVLIDQEGGRVVRMGAPHWRAPPAPARLGALAVESEAAALRAVRLNAQLIAHDLAGVGITINCAPVLDLGFAGADRVVGDRALGASPALVAQLGRAACEGFFAGAVLPVIKHMPGHGRAAVDSHLSLPVVTASLADLDANDYVPFRALNDMPLGITAHVCYTAIDPDRPATLSPIVIADAIRGAIGFDGLLFTDDLSMGALSGTVGERAAAALAAGCDVALHCNGDWDEMTDVARSVKPLTADASMRYGRATAMVEPPEPFDPVGASRALAELLGE